ncbi:MAG: urea carboxylase-associated family protein, partial [Micrococcales bacterium]|nr:urea carboxylase-associated family protein [Micrococcales bacterium]
AEGWTRVAPQTGVAVELAPGDRLTLLDPCGEQVSDLYLVRADDLAEQFSSGRTTDFGNSVYVSTGSLLWSNRSTVLAEVVEDTVGVHDLTLTPCSQATFDVLYPDLGGAPHPSCFANLAGALEPYGVDADRIGVTLNVFMDVWTDERGELHIDPPPTRPGDRFTIEARVPLVAGVTACSAEKSNNGRCTPVDLRLDRAARRTDGEPVGGVVAG